MGSNDGRTVRYSRGTGKNFGKGKNKASSIAEFRKFFTKPIRTKETFEEFRKLSREKQFELKSIGGWFYRAHIEGGRRTSKSGRPTDIFTLDIDFATPDFIDLLELGLMLPLCEFIAHSTRRHTPDTPRLRIIGFFSRPVAQDEYDAIVRIIAHKFDPDMVMVDGASFRRAQMMFLPTASIDAPYLYYQSEGKLFDPDQILEEFERKVGDWRDNSLLPRVEGERIRLIAEKAEDPKKKRGPVGNFCRAYNIHEAIKKFLPDVYKPIDGNSDIPRYTYLAGTTTGGAVVLDGGLFLYSHHSSDPCADTLVNSFDLVRINKFADLDEGVSKEAPITRSPSYKAMLEFIAEDPSYKREQVKSNYDQQAMFDDVSDDYWSESGDTGKRNDKVPVSDPRYTDNKHQTDLDELLGPAPAKFGTVVPPKDWLLDVELNKAGNIVQNLPNAQVIIRNDPRLFGVIGFNEFMNGVVLRRDILSKMDSVPPAYCRDKTRGEVWQDYHDITVRAILAAPNGKGKGGYGIDKLPDRDLRTALELTARLNTFHPIKDYLKWCHEDLEWDEIERVETFFVDYLGVPDGLYAREAAKAVLVASVARIHEPGHKFDYAPVIQGPQGIRKSTLIETLYGAENFGELTCNLRDTQKIAETIGGIWGMEFPELASFYKSDHNDAKQFLSAKEDRVRMAYDRRVSVFPRQATFWGTTNDKKYLKDPTGNRRWWPMLCNVNQIDTVKLSAERDQIWAEAMAIYKTMREKQPVGALPLYLTSSEAQDEANRLQTEARARLVSEDWADMIKEWADTPISLQELHYEYERGDRMRDLDAPLDLGKVPVLRCAFRVMDAARFALGIEEKFRNEQVTQNLDRAISNLDEWENESARTGKKCTVRRFGMAGRWKVRKDATDEEILKGYRVLPDEDGLD